MALRKNFRKKSYFNSIYKITRMNLNFAKRQTCSASCWYLNEQYPVIELRFKIRKMYLFKKNRTPLVGRGLRIIFVCILLPNTMIFKTSWYTGLFEYSYMRCSCTTENNRKSNKKEILKAINTTNIIQWKIYWNGQQVIFSKTLIEIEVTFQI